MAFDIFSKRGKPNPDIFVYEPIPEPFRQQVKFIIEDCLQDNELRDSTYEHFADNSYFGMIKRILTREYGIAHLYFRDSTDEEDIFSFLLWSDNSSRVIDTIELLFKGLYVLTNIDGNPLRWKEKIVDEVVAELNHRFKEHSLGYRFEEENRVIIRADNELLHQNIVQPLLYFISHLKFKTVNDEYISAHNHFRHGRNKECLNDCLKAFESAMKIICAEKGFPFDKKDTSSALIKVLYDNNFIPPYLKNKVSGLRSTLESGVPTIRNRNSGHGQGTTQITVNDSLASYCLNLTGSTIKFLVELL